MQCDLEKSQVWGVFSHFLHVCQGWIHVCRAFSNGDMTKSQMILFSLSRECNVNKTSAFDQQGVFAVVTATMRLLQPYASADRNLPPDTSRAESTSSCSSCSVWVSPAFSRHQNTCTSWLFLQLCSNHSYMKVNITEGQNKWSLHEVLLAFSFLLYILYNLYFYVFALSSLPFERWIECIFI